MSNYKIVYLIIVCFYAIYVGIDYFISKKRYENFDKLIKKSHENLENNIFPDFVEIDMKMEEINKNKNINKYLISAFSGIIFYYVLILISELIF